MTIDLKPALLTSKDFVKDQQLLIEADLSIHPFQGNIVCWQESWSKELKPLRIFSFSRESHLLSSVLPGDLILCNFQSLYNSLGGKVVKITEKIETLDQLTKLLEENSSLRILAWDNGLEPDSPLFLARDFMNARKEIESGKALSSTFLFNFLNLFSRITQLDRSQILFHGLKIKLIDKIVSSLNSEFIEKLVNLLDEYDLSTKTPLLYLLDIVAGPLRKTAPTYRPSLDIGSRLEKAFTTRKGEKRVKRLRSIFISDFKSWLVKHSTRDLDLKHLTEEYNALKETILEMKTGEVEQAVIFVRGKIKREYHITSLRESSLGRRLLMITKVSDRKIWVDQETFNLIKAAVKRLKMTLVVKPYPKPKRKRGSKQCQKENQAQPEQKDQREGNQEGPNRIS